MLTGFSLPLILFYALVVGAGALVYRRGAKETARQRLFLLLAWIIAALLVVLLITTSVAQTVPYGFATLLAPFIAGATALILLRRNTFSDLQGTRKTLALLALLISLGALAAILWGNRPPTDPLRGELLVTLLATIALALLLAVTWGLGRRSPLALGLFTLVCLTLFNALGGPTLTVLDESSTTPRVGLSLILYIALSGFVVGTIAILLASGSSLLRAETQPDRPSRRARAVRLTLSVLLLAAYLYTFAWAWLWDGTNDGLRGLVLLTVSGVAAVAAAVMLAFSTTGWRRWAGLLYPALLLGLMSVTVNNVWPAGNQTVEDMTESRAARIAQAIETYHSQNGRYPDQLMQLVPGQLWQIPAPMIIPGESWCYEGSANYYRLGTVYREHWSAPSISVRVYASAGDPPQENWICDERLAQLRPRYDMAFAAEPTRQPLPASAVAAQATTVQPLVSEPFLEAGSWSPDGAYLVYGATTAPYGTAALDLHFLHAETGEICRGPNANLLGLRQRHAWLPDGRLLYVSEAGRLVAVTPCDEEGQEIATRDPAAFIGVSAFDPQSGRLLLSTGEAYWLLDGATLEAQPLSGVVPPPEVSFASSALSLGGERLAMVASADQATNDSATVVIAGADTAEVIARLSLPLGESPDLPWLDWLTPDALLVQGNGLFHVVDASTNPPQIADFLSDVFLLDLSYPTDFSGSDWVAAEGADGYYLALRANHSRNQNSYIYDSQTEQVTVFEHDTHSLLFTPGGEGLQLPKWEDEPSYRDEYQIEWLDRPGESQRLTVQGHMPREHPQIFPQFTPDFSRLVISSSQGLSLVSIPGGETIAFWELAGDDAGGRRPLIAPNGEALVVIAGGDGLYYIPLPPSP